MMKNYQDATPRKITLDEWDARYEAIRAAGHEESFCGGPLRRHLDAGDTRLTHLMMDNSAAALDLWNLLLTEEERLAQARADGKLIVGTMKDLGTVPVMVYSLDRAVAFYPDGAWWIPCIEECGDGLLQIADRHGIDDSYCPVRAMLGAYVNEAHFPIPDLTICSTGATCDDVSAIVQRIESLGHPIHWWEIPYRRHPDRGEPTITLPHRHVCGGQVARKQFDRVVLEMKRLRDLLEKHSGQSLDDATLAAGIQRANHVRTLLCTIRDRCYTAEKCPMPSLEMLIAEMLAIHFCSDLHESLRVLQGLLTEIDRRLASNQGVLDEDAARVFWVNPVADLRIMNLLEEAGGRVCGSEYLFCHALDPIDEMMPPIDALAAAALSDPMIGPAADRAERVVADMRRYQAEAVVVARIPGASHCATEGQVIAEHVRRELGVPVLDIEIPPLTDAMQATLQTRLEALVETVKAHR